MSQIHPHKYIPVESDNLSQLSCSDAVAFQARMLKIRKVDDKIINILNTEIPTESFYLKKNPASICHQLQDEFHDYYNSRENAIKKCVESAKDDFEKLKATNNPSLSDLREKSHNLRMFQQELDIEQIYRARSLKAVDERCSSYY